MRKRRRVPALMLALFLFLSNCPVASATEVQPRFTYLIDIATSITFNANEEAVCKAKATTISDYRVKVVCKLQKYSSDSWVTLAQWSDEGNYLAYIQGTRGVEPGNVYRVYTVAMILDDNGAVLERFTLTDTERYL